MADDAFVAELCKAIASPAGARALLCRYDAQQLVEYLLKRLVFETGQKDTSTKALLARAIAGDGVRCAETNILLAPDDVQGVVLADGRLMNSVSAANGGELLLSPIVGTAVSPPAPADALQILRAIVAEEIERGDKPLPELQALLPPDATDGFLVMVRGHAGGVDDPTLKTAAKAVLDAHREDVQRRAKRVQAVLANMESRSPPAPPAPRDAAPQGSAPDRQAVAAPEPASKRARVGDVAGDELPPDGAGPIQKTNEGRWPRVDGVTVMTTKYGGPCKGCPRQNVAQRTVIAPKEEPDGSTKWCCTLCVINKTSAAVYTEIHQARIAEASAGTSITSFF